MSQLILNSIPSFSDLPDSAIAAGKALTDATLLAMAHNTKFATVRGKLIFMGFYAHGNTVRTPVDPDDYYQYARSECQYLFMPYSNRAPAPGFIPGQMERPAQSSSQPGTLYNWPGGWAINDVTGLVTLWTSYDQNGNEVVNNDGIIKVYAICCRMSVTTRPSPPAPQQPAAPTPAPPAAPPAPALPAGNIVATVPLQGYRASLGSPTSPVTIFVVGASDTNFGISCYLYAAATANTVLNSKGQHAAALVTLVFGWTYPTGQVFSQQISAGAQAGFPTEPAQPHNTGFIAEAGTAIWYYTIWQVDPEIAAQSAYDLNITLEQFG